MTSQRVNPFADISELPVFETRPKKETPVARETIERIAEENNFPSRQAPRPKEPKRKRRVYRTGRNRQLSIKVTSETVERFYKMADERKATLGALLEQALDSLDRAGASA